MKAVAAVWTLYIFSLTMFPCDDGVLDVHQIATTIHHAPIAGDYATDSCSPFCLCSCCSVHFNFSWPVTTTPEPIASIWQRPKTHYLVREKTPPAYSIWQPPKLGVSASRA